MPVFTDEAMTRPLFEELTLNHARADEWSEPLGFMIGGIATPSRFDHSKQYFDAATLLVDAIKRREWADYELCNAVLFLYRHSIELILKSAMGTSPKGHRLDELAVTFQRLCKDQYGQDVPAWITARLNEIARIDPNSTVFRYAENWDKNSRTDVSVEGELHADLVHLQRAMAALYVSLVSVAAKINGSKPGDKA